MSKSQTKARWANRELEERALLESIAGEDREALADLYKQ